MDRASAGAVNFGLESNTIRYDTKEEFNVDPNAE